MSESTVRMKIGNCERWRQWASVLSGRGSVSRRRAPLMLEWMRQFGLRQLRLHVVRGGQLSRHFHLHLAVPIGLRYGSTLAQTDYGDTQAITFMQGPAATAGGVDPVTRYIRMEQARSNSVDPGSAEFLRLALERTRRVEHRVSTREFVLVRGPGARAAGTVEESGRTPAHWTAENSGTPAYTRPLAAPPVNVDQIADTVMRQLDRRIGSWRERMGRL